MQWMAQNMAWIMTIAGLIWLFGLIVVVLLIAALVKYLRS